MYDSRQTQQWDNESSWWDTLEGKKWLASQNMRDATDFWNQFGAAHKYWTFEEMCKHKKQIKKLTKHEPKNARGTKDLKQYKKRNMKHEKTIQKTIRNAWPRSQKLVMTKEEEEEEEEAEKAAREKVIGIYETACAAASAIRDEYIKGSYLWPTQRPGMTKEEMKAARMA